MVVMLKFLSSLHLGSLFGGGEESHAPQPQPQAGPGGPAPGPGGLAPTGPVDPAAAAAAFSHYAEPPAPRFTPEMQTVYMRLLESGASPAQARATLMGMAAQPDAQNEPGANARGITRYRPGYGPTPRIR